MAPYNEMKFYILYSFCLASCFCSIIIVFHTSLEVIKLAYLLKKVDIFAVYSLTLYSHLKQNFKQCLKKN